MTRRIIGLVLGLALLGALAVAAWVAPAVLLPRLEAAAARATGHAVTIRGVRLSWAGGPALEALDVTVANASWGSRPDMLHVAAARGRLRLSELAHGTLLVDAVRLDAPDLLLEIAADGRRNWDRADGAASPAAPEVAAPGSGGRSLSLQIADVSIASGRLMVRDSASGRSFATGMQGVLNLALNPMPVRLVLDGSYGAFTLDGTIDRGDPLARSKATLAGQLLLPQPIPVTVHVTPGDVGPAIDAHAKAGAANVTLSAVLDRTTLQPAGGVMLDAKTLAPDNLAAIAGFDLPVPGPASLHASVTRNGAGLAIRAMRLTALQGDLTGDLDIELAPRPSLRAKLSSSRLDLSVLPAAPTPPAAATSAEPPAAAIPAAPRALVPAWLDRADADVSLTAAQVLRGGLAAHDVAIHAVLRDGVLTLDKSTAKLAGGTLTVSSRADTRAKPPVVALALHAPSLDAAAIASLAGTPDTLRGTAAVDADLHAAGDATSALMATLGGRVSWLMAGGELDLQVFTRLLAAAHLPVRVAGRAPLRCLVLRADIAGGVAHFGTLIADTIPLLVQGSGDVDLPQRTIALHLQPLLRTGPGLVIPVSVSGPWGSPKLDVDRRDLVGTALTALAGVPGDACQTTGLAVPPLPRKAPKPLDLLRGLLQ